MTKILLFGLLLPTVALAIEAPPLAPPVAVTQDWAFRWGDSPVLPSGGLAWLDETQTADWRAFTALTVPPGSDAGGTLWIRIPLPKAPPGAGEWHDPSIFLGAVSGAFEVYAGGQRVFHRGDIRPGEGEKTEFSLWNIASIDPSALGRPLFLRIQSMRGPNMAVQRAFLLGSRADLLREVARSGWVSFMIGMLSLVLAVLSLVGLVSPNLRQPLAAAAAFFATSGLLVISLSDLRPVLWEAPGLWYRLLLLSANFLAPLLGVFIAVVIASPLLVWFRWFVLADVIVASIVGVMILIEPDWVMQSATGLWILLMVAGLMVNNIVAALEVWRGNPDARIFVGGVVVLLVIVVYDSLQTFGVHSGDGYHTYLALLALNACLLGIIARRFMTLQQTLVEHARQLEERHDTNKGLSERLSHGARELIGAVQRLRSSSAQQNMGVTQQSASVQEVQATASEIHQTSQLAAEKANATMAAATNADEVSRRGVSALEQSLGGLQGIQVEVAEMARRIIALDSRTREIVSIVETVKDLADQSNILALNAAIEATRAGEHGKGFAVVAREVRRLADQSIQSTIRIREILAGVSDGIREAATLSERGEGKVRQSLEQVQASGEQLRKLSDIVHETSNTVRQISAAVNQQSAGVAQVFTAVNELSRQMSETLDRLHETEEATALVERVGQDMAGLVVGQVKSAASDGKAKESISRAA